MKKSNEFQKDTETIQEWMVSKLAEHVGISCEEINIKKSFADYGMSSVAAVSLSGDLEEWLGRRLDPTLLWDYPNIEKLAKYLARGK